MKYLVVLLDGASDYPNDELNGRTPLECANTPTLDFLAQNGEQFLVRTVRAGEKPGSDTANLSILGYDPCVCYTGRSPLEAASLGVKLDDADMCFRLNMVTLSDEVDYQNKKMVDYSADEVTTEEASALISALNNKLGTDKLKLFCGVSYRHLMVIKDCVSNHILTAPHDIQGKEIGEFLPKSPFLSNFIRKSNEILQAHPVNLDRIERGLRPANGAWLWGEGTAPHMENFYFKNGVKGGMVSAVDLLKGIARLVGMECPVVEGATGNLNTNYDGKAKAAKALFEKGCEYVYVHIEAPDECGHRGEVGNKVKSIELIDAKIVAPLYDFLEKSGDNFRIMCMPDHHTPLILRTHAEGAVPCVIYSKGDCLGGAQGFSEKSAGATGRILETGHKLIDYFLGTSGELDG